MHISHGDIHPDTKRTSPAFAYNTIPPTHLISLIPSPETACEESRRHSPSLILDQLIYILVLLCGLFDCVLFVSIVQFKSQLEMGNWALGTRPAPLTELWRLSKFFIRSSFEAGKRSGRAGVDDETMPWHRHWEAIHRKHLPTTCLTSSPAEPP